MNEIKAIKYLKAMLPEKVSYCEMLGASACYGDIMTYTDPEPYAIEAAIEALEKQVAKKVVVTTSAGYGEIYSCPVCSRDVSEPEKYCSMCGTKIDWSESDE